MEEKPFRVLLDFSEVTSRISGLKYVWMYISPRELNTVNDFKQAIIKKFSFSQREAFKLFVRDGLLLETEKIAILREDDIVKLQLEEPFETSLECSAMNTEINYSEAQASYSLTNNMANFSKSLKRKSDTFQISSKGNENVSLSPSHSMKKKKQDKAEFVSDESTSFCKPEVASVDISQNLPSLENNSKFSVLSKKDENNKQKGKGKKRQYPKTPTSDFIAYAAKLSEVQSTNQSVPQVDANAKNSLQRIDNITSLYKTVESVGITNLSPIPEMSTSDLSYTKTLSNVTESFAVGESLGDSQSSIIEEEADEKKNRKRKRRRRKRKVIPSTEDIGSSVDVDTEMKESFLTDVKANETYNTSSDARKHIIFNSPSPPKTNTTITLESNPDNSFNVSKKLQFENYVNLDSSKKSFKDDSQLCTKIYKGSQSVNMEIEDFKESTPFAKKKSKEKSWGVTPLPRISSSSHTFSVENSDVSKSEAMKQAYEDFTPLNCLPPVGTRLAYKTLELNEDYCPEVTEYKEGILRKVNPNTDELEIELIQEEIKPGRSGKFENLWKNEPIPDDQVIKTVSLNWSALIDPRLIPQQNEN